MKAILKTEEMFKFALCYWLTLQLGFAWWTFFAWLLVPDLSMAGYVVNTRIGAFFYNLVHHQGIAIIVGFSGAFFHSRELEFAGVLLFGHSSMDRIFGYGLKYPDNFKNTHLGVMS